MSVLIKGLKMPKEGEYRMTLYVCDGGYAYMDVDSFPVDEDRFDAVPVSAIEDLPTTDPVKHGRWIEIKDDVFASTYRCSECGCWPLTEYDRWALTDYCPHCGALMERSEE